MWELGDKLDRSDDEAVVKWLSVLPVCTVALLRLLRCCSVEAGDGDGAGIGSFDEACGLAGLRAATLRKA